MYGRSRLTITPGMNNIAMRQLFPDFTFDWKKGTSTWRGWLQPRPDEQKYRVCITYRNGDKPRVKIIRPELAPKTPHLYAGEYLCLYYPADRTWHSGLYVATTIVPMTAEWLLFYELWLQTGTWWGPEAPHSPGAAKDESDGHHAKTVSLPLHAGRSRGKRPR